MACASDTIWPAAAPRRRRPPRPEMLLSSHLEGEEGGKKDAVVVFPFEKVFPVYAMGRLPGPDTPPSVSLPGDPIWEAISREAKSEAEKEPILSSFLYASIVAHDCLEQALAFVLANRLQNPTLLATQLLDIFSHVISNDPGIRCSIRLDAQAFKDRDPACLSYCSAVLYLKVHFSAGWCPFASPFDCINGAFFFSRATTPCNPTEWLMCCGTKEGECWHWHCRVGSARWFHQAFGVDIHPAAKIGEGILLDHGTGVVIGETAVVGNRVSLLHGVTLGGTGKEIGDRHPKVGDGALIGACATILGKIRIGEGAMIASGSLVLKDVPPHSMVAGTPSKVIGYMDEKDPSLTMNHDAAKEFFKHVAASFKEDWPIVNDNHRVDVEMCPAAPRCTDSNGHA